MSKRLAEWSVWGRLRPVLCLQFSRCRATVVLIRHADVTGTGDPSLNAAGQARAQELRHVLQDSGISAVFHTHWQRSRQTAEPVAADLGVTPTELDDPADVVTAIKALDPSARALVVGHTNTVPDVITGLGGPAVTIDAAEFDKLFVLSRGQLTRLRYGA